ncbi:16S rRNA (guanine(966)-N(2))-methyltransferase RsmD [Angustibacter peucedani]
MTRVIAGSAGGRRLQVPPGRDTRPTSDRVREALFSRLEHEGWLDATRVLDLYAGSGALGLEAVSRGARAAVLVEDGRAAAGTIRRNVASTGLAGVTVLAARVERVLARPPEQPFDLVLADPPYPLDDDGLAEVLDLLVANDWLAEHAALVVERATRSPQPRWPAGVRGTGERGYGETRLWFAER